MPKWFKKMQQQAYKHIFIGSVGFRVNTNSMLPSSFKTKKTKAICLSLKYG